ncbi:hypothetical protein Y1Q_0022528 [Alligator mississippiensis]|uniref:Uncharacterized protein n=1 Tax=Alligator mississippiensis TaxID=8496 RepID=A0A151NW70_ALLMI|nr:hypothetical protein Y1Q_0022528 [Alligator mississippiensis]
MCPKGWGNSTPASNSSTVTRYKCKCRDQQKPLCATAVCVEAAFQLSQGSHSSINNNLQFSTYLKCRGDTDLQP